MSRMKRLPLFIDNRMKRLVVILCLCSLLPVSVESFEYDTGWLIQTVYKCTLPSVSSSLSLRGSRQYFWRCVALATRSCIKDTMDYSVKPIQIDNFCGLIDSHRIRTVPMTWHINGYSAKLINFQIFSLPHEFWRCTKEKVVVSTLAISHRFCGNRFPWKMNLRSSRIKIEFFSSMNISKIHHLTTYFQIQIHNSTLHKNYSIIPNIGNSTFALLIWKRFVVLSYHFIAGNKLGRIDLYIVGNGKDLNVVCHDGPGQLSPILQHKSASYGIEFLSTAFHLQ